MVKFFIWNLIGWGPYEKSMDWRLRFYQIFESETLFIKWMPDSKSWKTTLSNTLHLGMGRSLITASVITPKVPSEPRMISLISGPDETLKEKNVLL